MRSTTAGELTTLGLLNRTVTWRVKIANGSGTMIDLSSWVEHVSRNEDVDQPVSGATVEFTRANGVLQTLSPLRTDSTLNVKDDLTYAPQIDLVRAITYEVATTPIGVLPNTADFKLKFKGATSTVNFASNPIVVDCRDEGGLLVDRFVEAPKMYGSTPGVALETVMQAIHDDVLGAGVVPVWTPVSPSYLISPAYQQQIESVMDADVALAQNPGWDVRYRWDDGTGTFRFKLSQPDRTKTVPDYTFGPKDYFDVMQLELSETDIRNVIIVSFRDSAAQNNRKTISVSDGPSITKYRRRPLLIVEGDTSPINTVAEATAMANAALADLKDPKAEVEIVMPFFWPAELGDLYRFSANGVHFNTDQDWAVVSVTDDLSPGRHETRLKLRGKPAGQYLTWLARGGVLGPPGVTVYPPTPFFDFLDGEVDDTIWNIRFSATQGTGGGGTNLTYTVTSKRSFDAETTIASGNESTLPRDLAIARDPKYEKVITFTVFDAATGMSAADSFSMPSQRPEVNSTANILRSRPLHDGGYALNAEDAVGQTIATGGRGKSDFATKNSGGSTAFGVNRHNDEQGAVNGAAKTFGVSYDSIPQMRALPQNWTLPGTNSTVDRKIEFAAVGVSVAGYSARAVYSTGSSSSAQTENPATTLNGTPVSSVALVNQGDVAYWDLSNANSVLTNYSVHYDVDTSVLAIDNTVNVNIYVNNGTGSTSWTLVGSEYYTSGQTLTDQIISFAAALALDWDVRILLDYENSPAVGHKATITAKACTYDKITAGTEVALTGGAGNAVLFQAMEAP